VKLFILHEYKEYAYKLQSCKLKGWVGHRVVVFSVKPGLGTSRLHPKTSHQITYLPIKYKAMHKTKEITETRGELAENMLILL